MKYLLDASALFILLKKNEDNFPNISHKMCILDLTVYEVGNVVWKTLYLMRKGKPDKSSTKKLIDAIEEILSQLTVYEVKVEDFSGILDTSLKLGLTYYDAAYVYYAEKYGLTLITEDKKILEKYIDLLPPIHWGDSLGTDKRRCHGAAKPRYPYPTHPMWTGLGVIAFSPIWLPPVTVPNQRGWRRQPPEVVKR